MAGEVARVAERIELNGMFAQMLGVWHPKEYVVAAIDAADGEVVVEDLLAAGYIADAIQLHDSARVLRDVATISATDEGLMSQEYLDEAGAGASLVAVRATRPVLVDEVRRILAARGARRMRFYGDRSITPLS